MTGEVCCQVRVELRGSGDGAASGSGPAPVFPLVDEFVDEHLSVRWDDDRAAPWRDSADVLWHGGPLPSRPAAYLWGMAVLRGRPGALVACAGYGWGRCLAVRAGSPPLTVYVAGGEAEAETAAGAGTRVTVGTGTGTAAAAVVASLLHAFAAAGLPLDRPLRVQAVSRRPGGAGRWALHLVPDSEGGSGSSSATRAATRPTSGAPTPS